MNVIGITGRLTAAPELKTTESGKYVMNFCVAVKRKFAKDKTDFVDCIAWEKTAEFISQYFSKGKMIAVEGSLTTENFTDKDGKQRKSTRVLVSAVDFCGDNSEGNDAENGGQVVPIRPKTVIKNSTPQQLEEFDGNFEEIADDDLPF